MAIKGLSELLEKWKKEEIKDATAFEAELTKGGLYEGYIPKDKFDEKNTEAKKLKEQLDAQTKLVNELKDKGNLSDEYKSQIDKLKAENEEKDKTYKAEIQKMRKDAAIEKALAGAKVREAKAFMPYLDENKILVNDDGTVTGLNEQIEAIKKDHAFLFNDEAAGSEGNEGGGNGKPHFGNGGNGGGGGGGNEDDAFFEKMRAAAGLK